MDISCLRRRADGGLTCWGFGDSNLLRAVDGSHLDATPRPITGPLDLADFSLGGWHQCLLMRDGDVFCWGDNRYGQVGNGDYGCPMLGPTASQSTPTLVFHGARNVTTGGSSTCAVSSDDQLYCWGFNNGLFELAGTVTLCDSLRGSAMPRRVPLTEVVAVSLGGGHQCAIRRDGSLWCWGANSVGQLGRALPASSELPLAVPGMTDVTQVCAGSSYTCALRRDGSVWCWGRNDFGQLGDGTLVGRAEPRRVEFAAPDEPDR